jgi:hypothetical protein
MIKNRAAKILMLPFLYRKDYIDKFPGKYQQYQRDIDNYYEYSKNTNNFNVYF